MSDMAKLEKFAAGVEFNMINLHEFGICAANTDAENYKAMEEYIDYCNKKARQWKRQGEVFVDRRHWWWQDVSNE